MLGREWILKSKRGSEGAIQEALVVVWMKGDGWLRVVVAGRN